MAPQPLDVSIPTALAPKPLNVGIPPVSTVIKGRDGYTPVKGKDYWTDEEVAEITREAKEAATIAIQEDLLVIDCGRAGE